MRKKTITNLCDNIFWYILYMLPVLLFLLQSVIPHYQVVPIDGLYDVQTTNYLHFAEFMGENFDHLGASPLFPIMETALAVFRPSAGVISMSVWFVNMMIVHLFVDFILFIPRLCHKFMGKFTQND